MASSLPPLNPLRTFVVAGRLLSIRRAADELHVTPAAVSRQVKTLESHLGVALFKRTPSSLILTAAGESYLEAVSAHLDAIADATLRLTGRQEKDVLKIRAYTTFAMKWLIPRLSHFHHAFPGIEVQLTTSLEAVNFQWEDVDGAIRLGDGNWSGLAAERLVANELVPVCSPSLAESEKLTQPGDLARVHLLHSLARPNDWRLWLNAAGLATANADSGSKFQSSALCYEAAVLGQGVAIAQKALVERELGNGSLVIPFGPACDLGAFTYYLVFPQARLRKMPFRNFRNWLRTEAVSAAGGVSGKGSGFD